MPTEMAPTRGQPCQLDRRIRYDRTTPAQTEKIRKVRRRFSGICGASNPPPTCGSDETACCAGGACCPILLRPERAPPTTKHKANTRHTTSILRAVIKTLPAVIAARVANGYSNPPSSLFRQTGLLSRPSTHLGSEPLAEGIGIYLSKRALSRRESVIIDL